MKSQFGEATNSLTDTYKELKDLVDLLSMCPEHTRAHLTRLEGLLKMLDYFTQPPAEDNIPTAIPDVRCHVCNKHWTVSDACLLLFDQQWLCRDHHPPLSDGSIRPPGYTDPRSILDKLEEDRRNALKALSRVQLRLVNSRVGG